MTGVEKETLVVVVVVVVGMDDEDIVMFDPVQGDEGKDFMRFSLSKVVGIPLIVIAIFTIVAFIVSVTCLHQVKNAEKSMGAMHSSIQGLNQRVTHLQTTTSPPDNPVFLQDTTTSPTQ